MNEQEVELAKQNKNEEKDTGRGENDREES
jgi:hypothetical protein